MRLNTLDQVIHSLANKRPAVIGTSKANWKETAKPPFFFVPADSSYGHAILVVGYNKLEGWLKCKNSYGDGKYDKGYFYIKFSDFDKLFTTKYSLVDKSDIDLYKKRIMENIKIENAKKAFEEGVWSGTNPQGYMTREEAMAVIYEQINKIKLAMK
jgi:C1A family cysteine protease